MPSFADYEKPLFKAGWNRGLCSGVVLGVLLVIAGNWLDHFFK